MAERVIGWRKLPAMLLIPLLLSAAAVPQTTVTIPAHDSKCIASVSAANWNDNRF